MQRYASQLFKKFLNPNCQYICSTYPLFSGAQTNVIAECAVVFFHKVVSNFTQCITTDVKLHLAAHCIISSNLHASAFVCIDIQLD